MLPSPETHSASGPCQEQIRGARTNPGYGSRSCFRCPGNQEETVAPAARVFLGVACAALTSTLLSLLCLTVGGAPRGLESGHLPRADQCVPAGPGSGAPSLRTACQERLEWPLHLGQGAVDVRVSRSRVPHEAKR
ncbi:PREDICTED: protein CEI [Myotis brandtii]|uniref:protein CEI n=1 Tax=Myotis brandtii TaxID=109478 RepID=UPI0007046A17|nr:PREDICTED: protein CEI [Myotis brandtii]